MSCSHPILLPCGVFQFRKMARLPLETRPPHTDILTPLFLISKDKFKWNSIGIQGNEYLFSNKPLNS